jgi:hypothetical protein
MTMNAVNSWLITPCRSFTSLIGLLVFKIAFSYSNVLYDFDKDDL